MYPPPLDILRAVADERGESPSVQIAAAALAAVTSAVLLSTLGVTGTLMGAALGSVAASIGSVVYSRGLHAGRDRVVAKTEALRRVARARIRMDDAAMAVRVGRDHAEGELALAEAALDDAEQALREAESSDEPVGRRLPWRRISVVTLGVFLAAMLAITTFELLSGRAVSTWTGGSEQDRRTTVPGLGRQRSAEPTRTPGPTQRPSMTSTSSTSPAPSPSPTTTTSTTTPTAAPTAAPPATPTEAPSTALTEAPTTPPSVTASAVPPEPSSTP